MPGTPRNFRLFDYSYYYAYLAKIVIYAAPIIKSSLPNRRNSFSSLEGLRRIASLRPRRSSSLAGEQPSPPNFGVQQSVGTSSLRARITTLTETRFSSSPPAVQPFRSTPTILNSGQAPLPVSDSISMPCRRIDHGLRSRGQFPTSPHAPHSPVPSACVPTSLLPSPLNRSLASGGLAQPALVFAHERQCQCGGRFEWSAHRQSCGSD